MLIPNVHTPFFRAGCKLVFLAISLSSSAVSALEASSPSTVQTTPAAPQPSEQTAEAGQVGIQPNPNDNSFELMELRIKGNTLLQQTEVERTVYPFLGAKKNIETVEQARSTLENLYRAKGYQTVAVDIPEQDVENGVVYLQVVEGKISRLRVTNSRYFSLGKIKAAVPELAEGKVPNFPVMQQQLAAVDSQVADRKVTPILRAGDTPGSLEVDLKVKDELPLHGSLALNGRNTSATSRLRLVGSLHYDNLWQKMHSASLMYQVSPENSDEVEVWSGTYAMPIFDTDARLAFYAVSSSSNAQIANAGALSVVGIGNIYGLRFVKPFATSGHYNHSLTLGIDYKDFEEDLNLIGADTLKTPISYLPFMAQYNGSWQDKVSQFSFNTALNFSVRGLGNDQQEFENKRFNAKSNYVYLNGNLNYSRELPWGMTFFGRLAGQVSDSPLISNEQFSIGGMDSVRGYFETQGLADDGFTGSLELRSPHLVPEKFSYVDNLQALLFVDGGKGWTQQALPGTPKIALASVGVGMRFQVWKYFTGVLDLGFPLLDMAPVEQGDPKLHFNIATEF